MPVDRGGMDYRIRVEDQFSRNLGKFVSGLKVARSEWKGLRGDLERPIADTGVSKESDKATLALQRQRRASRELARQKAEETRQQKTNRRAIEEQNKAALRKELADRRGIVAARQSFVVEKRLLSVQEQNRRAVEAITRAKDRSNQADARRRIVAKQNIDLTRRERQELGLLTRAEQRQIAIKRERAGIVDRLRRVNRAASNERLAQLRAETIAQERINRARQKELVAAALQRRGRTDLIPGVANRPPEGQVSLFQRLTRALRGSDDAANRASFTFRRLFGILAAFTVARQVVAGFGALIRALIQTSAAIELAEVGLAGLITATTEIRNLEGTVVGAERGIAIAGEEARRQIRLLRLEALSTTASFEELLDAFQVGLAPGVQAGLNLDEVREFTVLISQAAAALGLEQRQLAEEIRSILSGTINIRQTRIAAALGLTNAEIRRAKETGDLIGFLRGELEAFRFAGREAAKTLTGLNRRLRDAFTQTLEAGGVGFIEELKQILSDALEALVSVNEVSQTIELNPKFVAAVEALSEGLSGAVNELRRIGESLDPRDIQDFASVLGGVVELLGALVANIIIGIVRGIQILRVGFNLLNRAIRAIPGVSGILDSEIWRKLTIAVISVVTIFIVLTSTFGALLSTAGFVLSVFGSLLSVFVSTAGAVASLAKKIPILNKGLVALRLTAASGIALFGAWAVAIASVVLALANLVGILDFDLSKSDLVNAIQFRLDQLTAFGEFLGKSIADSTFNFGQSADKLREEFDKKLKEANRDLEARATEQTNIIDEFKKQLAELPDELAKSLRKASGLSEKAINDIVDDFENTSKIRGFILPLSTAFDNLLEKINEFDKTFESFVDRRIQGTTQFEIVGDSFVNGLVGLFTTANREIRELSEESERALRSLQEQIGTVTEIIESTVDPTIANEQRGLLKGLIDQAERLQSLQAGVRASRFGILADEVTKSLEVENVRGRIAIEEGKIEAARTRALSIAEREGDTVGAALANIRAERARLDLEEGNRISIFVQQLNSLEAQLAVFEAQRKAIQDLDRELTSTEQASLDRINAAVASYQTQLDILRQQNDVLREQAEIKREDLERQQKINEFAKEQPILAGLAVEAYSRLNELSNVFLQTQKFIGFAIEEFAQTASQMIIDIFDPTTDASIKERFGRFLQSLAQQIISTLISLAVTAAILNAASGGLLGPLLQGFTRNTLGFQGGFGFNEGGKVDRRIANRAVAHPAHSRAEGRAHGGPSRSRPQGLHPKDTVPIWTAVGEWVIRARSVAKAGDDALHRINEGMFDRGMLRMAVGLPASPAKRLLSSASSGPGFVSGGRVASSAIPNQTSTGVGSIVVAPVIISNDDTVRDLLSGGRSALIEAIEKAGFRRQ